MQTVMITGAGRGIGREMALQYLENGWQVIATARSQDHLDALRVLGVRTEYADMSDFDSLKTLAERLQDVALDIFIANAAIGINRTMKITDWDIETWESSFRINSIAPALLAGLFLRNLRMRPTRKLVAITSGRASIANNDSGTLYAYRASKTALNAIWRNISVEEPDIIPLLVHPGRVRTGMGAADAELSPGERAEAVRRVIDRTGADGAGRYWAYDGRELPW